VLAHQGGADETLAVAFVFAALWVGWIGWSRLRGTGFARVPRAGAYAIMGVAVALVAGAWFVPRAIWPPPPTLAEGNRPRTAATVSFVSPRPGEVLTSDTVTVRVRLEGGTLSPTTTAIPGEDTGHLHLLLDGAVVSMPSTFTAPISLGGLSPGAHTLTAEYVASDHGPFDPRVTATVRFTKEDG
jgi:hypothetical protein